MLMKSPAIRKTAQPTTQRAYRSQIFIDKVVDPRKEPTLFNVESARMSVVAKTGPYRSVQEMRVSARGAENRRAVVARDTLAKMNVAVSTYAEDFSLLEDNSQKLALTNPRIMDAEDFLNTVNDVVKVTDKFPYDNDPFYQLDESLRSPRAYTALTVAGTGNLAPNPDLSCILSNLTVVNQKATYFGKNKYF